MARSSVLCCVLVCLLSAGSQAQSTEAQLTLGGSVTNSRTGAPVAHALVELIHWDARGSNSGTTSMTDEAGSFRFTGLSKGRYMVSARKPQFSDRGIRGQMQMQLDTSVENVQIKLAPLCAITGKITDHDRQPVNGVNVSLLRVAVNEGLRATTSADSVRTDDRGMFRFWNLGPGKYFVRAAGRGGGTYLYAGDSGPAYDSAESFAPAYFGGSAKREGAQAIDLSAGDEAQADIGLSLQTAWKIRGSLTNYTPRHSVRFELLSGDEDVVSSRVSVNSTTGAFEIQDVLPGSYRLRATDGISARGEVAVTVRDGDVRGMTLALFPAVEMHVMTHVTKQPAPAEGYTWGRVPSSQCHIAFFGEDNRVLSPQGALTGNSEEMTLTPLFPGRYRIFWNCFGGYATSILSGSQDLLANPTFVLEPGTVPPRFDVTMHAGGGGLEVALKTDQLSENSRPGVLLVPQFANSTGPQTSFFFGEEPRVLSRFSFGGLAPGDYLAFGFADTREVEYRNPEFVRTLSGGVPVHIQEDQVATIAEPLVAQ